MKRTLLQFIIVLALLLTACGQTSPLTPPEPASVSETFTPSPLPTSTQTFIPSPTRTASVTPLPTIPTFTPTFDVSTIVIVTPAPKAECPSIDNNISFTSTTLVTRDGVFGVDIQAVIDLLNKGAQPSQIMKSINQEIHWFDKNSWQQRDITDDGISELILTDDRVVYILGCKDGLFQNFLSETTEPAWLMLATFKVEDDMNLNGIPEVLIDLQGGHSAREDIILIYEWNGISYSSLLEDESADAYLSPGPIVQDIDKNKTIELILKNTLPFPIPSRYAHLIPWRNETHIYSWNGKYFSESQIEYETAQYRFQTIQDADETSAGGKYQTALGLYQNAIFKDQLFPWSKDIYDNEISKAYARDGLRDMPTVTPSDLTEYPRLAAYAYYRIMLINLVQNHESDAGTVYNTLQQKFSNDPYGSPYVEMASAFWDAYQSTHKMYDGCAAAIQYAVEHPEILTPLGSDYHGSQSHTYVPEDVCPFR
ncbi:MAG: hypothetical protein IPP66_00415 [Anaerolineales bacterium]|nr:hypothetical protein [Anaerolineales bacterium]